MIVNCFHKNPFKDPNKRHVMLEPLPTDATDKYISVGQHIFADIICSWIAENINSRS